MELNFGLEQCSNMSWKQSGNEPESECLTQNQHLWDKRLQESDVLGLHCFQLCIGGWREVMETINKINFNLFFNISLSTLYPFGNFNQNLGLCSQPHKLQTKKSMKYNSNFRNISSFGICLTETMMLGKYNWNKRETDSNDAFCFLCDLRFQGCQISRILSA